MLAPLFGNSSVEKILFFLLKNQELYARQLQLCFAMSISPLQNALDRLENGNIIVSYTKGRTRLYCFNPRYPFINELITLLDKAYDFLPEEEKQYYNNAKTRKRPRKRGKW